MPLRRIAFCILSICLFADLVVGDESAFVVVGYIPDYRLADWSQNCGPITDLIYFGMSLPANGKFDSSAISNQDVSVLQKIKSETKCQLLLTVGGWKMSHGFPAMAEEPRLRQQFIRDARDFCLSNAFDGIDFDWEHPRGIEQITNFAKLLQETHVEFAKHQLIVTVAQAPWQDLGRAAYEAVDRVHLMSYDHEFPQATFEKSKADVQRLIGFGCSRDKIVLGIPFYGRNRGGAAKSYAKLIENAGESGGGSVVDGFAFNNAAIISRKVRYARQRELAGVMVWELGQDSNGSRSLLRLLGKEVAK